MSLFTHKQLNYILGNKSITIFDDFVFYEYIFNNRRNLKYYTSMPKSRISRNSETYNSLQDIPMLAERVTILDGKSSSAILHQFPSKSENVFIRIRLRLRLIVIILGVIRKVIGNSYIIKDSRLRFKFFFIKINKNYYPYLLINNPQPKINYDKYINSTFDIQKMAGIFDFYNIEYVMIPSIKIRGFNYPIDRYYLKRGNTRKIEDIINQNAGDKLIHIIEEDMPFDNAMLPMFPAFIAEKIFYDSLIMDDVRVSTETIGEKLLKYNALFNYGLYANISSDNELLSSKNYFFIEIAEENSLEKLYDDLKKDGFVPHIDTQALMSINNTWLSHYIKSNSENFEIGLNVLIYRENLVKDGLYNLLLSLLDSNGILVLFKSVRILKSNDQLMYLRGGQWNYESTSYSPPAGFMILIYDNHLIHKSLKFIEFYKPIKSIKKTLRSNLDLGGDSRLHITDDTSQAVEYIKHLLSSKDSENLVEHAFSIHNERLDLKIKVTDYNKFLRLKFVIFLNKTKATIVKLIKRTLD